MKVVSTEALTKLIQLVKSAFIKVDDVVEVTEIETETPSEVELATVATSGSYNDLSNKPTIPTVNNAALTIQKNGSNVATFTANASSNVTANISVPNVTSTYTATGTDAVNGVAVSNAIATKQDTLVSGTNIKTINGTSLLGSGDIVIQSAPNLDNKSITKNTADELQTIGVINQNNTTTAIKTWTGTLAQYNAIATKDNNTLYNITDDNTAVAYQAYTKSEVNNLIEAIYPVGSIYIGTQSTCPLATLISGSTWVKVSEGRVLQGSDSGHNAGTTIEAGLPNITGTFMSGQPDGGGANPFSGNSGFYSTGSLYLTNIISNTHQITETASNFNNGGALGLDASRSSLIYGNSNTVQPPAFVVNIWKRTA